MKITKTIIRTPSAYSYPLLIKQLLHTPLNFAPHQEIVYRDLVRLTYRDFYERIHRLANALTTLGVGPGDTVAVMDWDSHRYLECFFAIPMLGAILHTVNVRLATEQVLYTMNHADDRVVLFHEDFLPLLEGIAPNLKNVETYILLKDSTKTISTTLPVSAEYEEMLANAQDLFNFPDFDEDTQATTFYSTGTTGDPKGVYYSHRQLVLHALTTALTFGCFQRPLLQSGDTYMPITPMFHVHAWGLPYVATMLGVKQVYPGRYEPETLLKLIESEKVTFSHCVPTIFKMIMDNPLSRTINLSGWKLDIGGSALSKALAQTALERGIQVTAGYGMSETCPLLALAVLKPHMLAWDQERQLEVQTKTGFPIPLVDSKIVDEDGRSLPMDAKSSGELLVRAPWLSQGYLKENEKSEELWKGGWLHTGDIATIDEEGYIQIIDRLKDGIKSGGEWISTLSLEDLILRHPGVSEVAVIGIPNEKWGERPLALAVPSFGEISDFPSDEVRKFLMKYAESGTIPKYAVPEKIIAVSEIPKTSVGKIDKKLIRRRINKSGYYVNNEKS